MKEEEFLTAKIFVNNIQNMIDQIIDRIVDKYIPDEIPAKDWDMVGFNEGIHEIIPVKGNFLIPER